MKRYEIDGGTRFITFSTFRRVPVLEVSAIADAFAKALSHARTKHKFQLFAWVVMPEHVHLLLRPASGMPLDIPLKSMKLSVSQWLAQGRKMLSAEQLSLLRTPDDRFRLWQPGGGFDRNVRSFSEFCREVRYIHRNPLTRGLVSKPEDWRWSSVRWWMSEREGEIECDPPPDASMNWAMWRGYM